MYKLKWGAVYSEIRNTSALAIPKVSSQNRKYIPMEILSPEIIAGGKIFMIPDITLYHFGILMSNVHMAWVRLVAGRLKSDFSYSSNVGINVGNYEITATSNNNYLFEDGSNEKNITCSINKITDSITFEEVESEYTGSNITPVFSNLSSTSITKTYYSDSNCQSSIEGKPKNVGTYYVSASSEGNEIYTSASITCSKVFLRS